MGHTGKTLLIGMNLVNEDGVVLDRIQVFGRIISVHPERHTAMLLRLNGSGQKQLSIPYTPDHWHPAKPGRYHLKSTGEIAEDPDFLATCSLTPGPNKTTLDARLEWLGTEGILPDDGTTLH